MSYGTLQIEKMTTESGYSLGAGNASSFKNRLINGGMAIDQRNAGASYTNSNQSLYGLDRWRSYGLTGAVLTVQQSTTAPAGFSNSQSVTVTTSTTANDGGGLSQIIEGNNVFDLNWGTSSGVAVTASFWVRSSVTGTYNVYLRYLGSTATYYYVATYTVNAANTWEQKTLNISAPPVGAGAFTAALNTSYLEFRPVISSSGDTTTVTANTWSTTNASKTAGCVDLASNSGATFFITGVQLEVGTVATSFDFRDFGRELSLCQRYFCKTYSLATVPGTATDTNAVTFPLQGACSYARTIWHFPVTMRATPTFVSYDTNTGTAGRVSGDASNYTNAALTVGEGRVTNGVSGVTIGVDVYLKWHGTASAEL